MTVRGGFSTEPASPRRRISAVISCAQHPVKMLGCFAEFTLSPFASLRVDCRERAHHDSAVLAVYRRSGALTKSADILTCTPLFAACWYSATFGSRIRWEPYPSISELGLNQDPATGQSAIGNIFLGGYNSWHELAIQSLGGEEGGKGVLAIKQTGQGQRIGF